MKKLLEFWFKVFRSFAPASKGILSGFGERNMRVHGLALVVVVATGAIVGLERYEWLFVLIAIGLVMAAELINTGIEELSNIVRDELHLSYQATRRARDVSSGAVLVLTVLSICIAVVVFLPKILEMAGASNLL
ncbi:MAG: diacylglycerol kinase family protein [Patescibacteria group bacterium]